MLFHVLTVAVLSRFAETYEEAESGARHKATKLFLLNMVVVSMLFKGRVSAAFVI
jgi:hypothetical protein